MLLEVPADVSVGHKTGHHLAPGHSVEDVGLISVRRSFDILCGQDVVGPGGVLDADLAARHVFQAANVGDGGWDHEDVPTPHVRFRQQRAAGGVGVGLDDRAHDGITLCAPGVAGEHDPLDVETNVELAGHCLRDLDLKPWQGAILDSRTARRPDVRTRSACPAHAER